MWASIPPQVHRKMAREKQELSLLQERQYSSSEGVLLAMLVAVLCLRGGASDIARARAALEVLVVPEESASRELVGHQ